MDRKPSDEEVVFFVYLDWTNEDPSRVFYVGKGNDARVKDVRNRSKVWKNYAQKYGWTREHRQVVLASKYEEYVYENEIRLIAEHGTYHHVTQWGANLTQGGEGGTSGDAHHMKKPEYVERMRRALTGRKDPPEVIEKKRAYQLSLGDKHPMKREEVRAKFVGDLNPARRPEVRKLLSEICPFKRDDVKALISGVNNANAKLDWTKVREIRVKYAAGGVSHQELAIEYGVTKRAVTCVINNLTWKEA